MDVFMQQLKKGVLEMLVLKFLAQKPSYGYELIGSLKESSNGLFAVKEGTLYPVLYRLEDEEILTSSWRQAEGRSTAKKYYHITSKGQKSLREKQEKWQDFTACIQSMLAEGAPCTAIAEDGVKEVIA